MIHERRKTLATWLAVSLGVVGAHRFYMHGARDPWAWLHVPLTVAGAIGVLRARAIGLDDAASALLIPLLGIVITAAMLQAIVYALTPDERWRERYNPSCAPRGTGWGPVLGAILALMVGGAALMSTIAFAAQRYFEWQASAVALRDTTQKSARLRA